MPSPLDRLRAETFPAVRGRALRPLVRHREMQFPTFPRAIHESIAHAAGLLPLRDARAGRAARARRGDPGRVRRARRLARRDQRVPARARARSARCTSSTRSPASRRPTCPPGADDRRFRDTSEAAVRARVGTSPNVVLRPGYVPDTLAGLEDEAVRVRARRPRSLRPDDRVARVLLPAHPARRLPRACTTTTTRSPTGRASARSTRFLADKPEQLVELGDMWGSALIRRAG